eukprot:COSAG06_NODE_35909_length_454_cov_0.723944_1_plen_20_part_10
MGEDPLHLGLLQNKARSSLG